MKPCWRTPAVRNVIIDQIKTLVFRQGMEPACTPTQKKINLGLGNLICITMDVESLNHMSALKPLEMWFQVVKYIGYIKTYFLI